ncbi:hypothetical protein NMY22_g19105 [Coprinellus aureogranulatus]|nr:hypothetical protein NMY22_g19105 [Coprinellus aureogranulatus]
MSPPGFLPPSINLFLGKSLGASEDEVDDLWNQLKDEVWNAEPTPLTDDDYVQYRTYGWPLGITALTLYPPNLCCTNPDCTAKRVPVFTKTGVEPAYAVVTYCPECNTSYHHDYSVRDGVRRYYEEMPKHIEVAKHYFVETVLVRLWIVQLLMGWYSFSNAAASHDEGMNFHPERYDKVFWELSGRLRQEHVSDGFVIVSLLDDAVRRGYVLEVPHGGDQSNRYTAAMEARNEWIVLNGQPDAVRHACNKCMRVYETEDGTHRAVQSIVTDGLSIGRPCCATFRCPKPLQNNRHRFCADHFDQHYICAVEGCERPVRTAQTTHLDGTVKEKQMKTCDNPVHADIEKRKSERSTGSFLLRTRLQHANISGQAASQDVEEEVETYELDEHGNVILEVHQNPGSIGTSEFDEDPDCPSKKAEGGNTKFKAKLNRIRTHNEQTAVRPCGVCLGRVTMYGAEAVSNILVMLKKIFSVPGARKPQHVFYDSNCDAHRQSRKDPWFNPPHKTDDDPGVGMCVDVWHFKNKHKVSHEYCQKNCNPAQYPELMDDDGSWFFNTSIAEQINAWLGGFHSICREMLPARYEFFLDEMMRLHNIRVIRRLAEAGHYPHEI